MSTAAAVSRSPVEARASSIAAMRSPFGSFAASIRKKRRPARSLPGSIVRWARATPAFSLFQSRSWYPVVRSMSLLGRSPASRQRVLAWESIGEAVKSHSRTASRSRVFI